MNFAQHANRRHFGGDDLGRTLDVGRSSIGQQSCRPFRRSRMLNTLTLGTSGINMLTANKNATLNFPLTLGSSQTWSIGSGRTLTAGGVTSDGGSAFGLTKTGRRHADADQ